MRMGKRITPPKSFKEIIRLWPNRGEFHRAIGVGYGAAQQMDNRDSINPRHWDRVIAAAKKIGRSDITFSLLMDLHRAKEAAKRDEAA